MSDIPLLRNRRSRSTIQDTGFEKFLKLANAPAETITRIIGSTLTDNPKYSGLPLSTSAFEQPGFSDLFIDAGLPPALAATLDFVANVANPLDPLNKIGIGSTKLGRVGTAAEEAMRFGRIVDKFVDAKSFKTLTKAEAAATIAKHGSLQAAEQAGVLKNVKQIGLFGSFADKSGEFTGPLKNYRDALSRQKAAEKLLTDATEAGADAKRLTQLRITAKSATRNADLAKRNLDNIRQQNLLLAQLQIKNGMAFDRIIDLPSKMSQMTRVQELKNQGYNVPDYTLRLERGKNAQPLVKTITSAEDYRDAQRALRQEEYRRGNRVLFGLQNTDPRKLPILPFTRQSLLDEAPRFGASKIADFSHAVQAKIAGVTSGVAQTLGGFARSQLATLGARMGFATLKSEQSRELFKQLEMVLGASRVDAEHFALEAANLRLRNRNMAPEEFGAIVDALENRYPTKRAETQILRDYLGNKPMDEIHNLIKSKTKEIPTTGTIAARSDAEVLMLQPPVPDDTELLRARASWDADKTEPIVLSGGHSLRMNDEFMSIKLNGVTDDLATLKKRFEKKSILTNSGIVPLWRVHQDADGTFLVARKMPGGTLAFPGIVDGVHLDNLSRGAGYLSRGSVYIPPIRATRNAGFGATAIVSPGGGVQLLDPELFSAIGKTSRGVKRSEARLMSETVLRQMADDFEIGNPLLMDFPALRSDLSSGMQHAGARYFTFRNGDDIAQHLGLPEDTVGIIGVRNLLDTAGNTSPIRDMIRGVTLHGMSEEQAMIAFGHHKMMQHANGVLQERDALRAARVSDPTGTPAIAPIIYTTTPTGQVFVVDGLDRLGAAALEGFQSVPIIRKPILANVSESTGIWTRPYAISLETAARIHPAPAAASRLVGSSHILGPYVDHHYRNLREGKAITLPEIATPKANNLQPDALLKMSRVFSFDPNSTNRLNAERIRLFDTFVKNAFDGDQQAATVAMAVIAERSSNVEEYVKNLREHFNTQLNRQLPIGWETAKSRGVLISKNAEFAQAREAATKYLDALADYGIFAESPAKLSRMWRKTQDGSTIITWDSANNRLVVMNAQADYKTLRNEFKAYLNQTADPSAIIHNDKVLIAANNTQNYELVSDFVSGVHPRTLESVPRPAQFQFNDKVRAELQRRGIYIDPRLESIKDEQHRRVYSAAFKRFADDKTGVFFFTRGGQLVIRVGNASPGADSVKNLAHNLLGEATDAIGIQEWGFVANGKLVINNPLGSNMPILNKANVALLEERIRHVAQKFRAAGLGNIEVEIASAFREDVWKQMIQHDKRRLTLDYLMSKEFRLEIPKGMENVVIDTTLRTTDSIVQIVRPKLPTGAAQEIFDWAAKNLDEAAAQDVRNGLPLKDWASYFPRIQTAEARDALNAVFSKAATKDPKLGAVMGAHASLKGRKFTDLTLREINDIFSKADFDMSKLLSHAETREEAAFLRALAEGVPGGLKFFYDDPILAVTIRRLRSYQAEAEQGILNRLQSMHDSGVLYHGTVGDIYNLRKDSIDIAAGERAVSEATLTRQQLMAELSTAQANGKAATVISSIEKRIQQAESTLDEALQHYNQVLRASRKKLGIHSLNELGERIDSVWLRGNDARELLEKGAITEDSIRGSVHGPLVRVQYDTVRQVSQAHKMKVLVVTPETEAVLAKLFNLRLNKNGEGSKLMQLYDRVNTLFKRWTLFPVPGFHTRNFLSNMILAWMGGVTDLESYSASFQAFRVLADVNPSVAPLLRSTPGYRPTGTRGIGPGMTYQEGMETLGNMHVYDISGRRSDMLTLWNEFVKHGGLQGGLVINEFSSSVARLGVDNDILRLANKHGLVPSSELASDFIDVASNVAPVRGGAKLASAQENFFRFATFYDAWRRTGDPTQAALTMKKIFYDYNELSQFEKVWLKRAIPFYSWMRFNTPRMLETIFTNPVAHLRMRNFFTAIENEVMDSPEDRKDLPKFINDRFGIVVGRDKKTGRYDVLAGDSVFPMFDAYRFLRGLSNGDPFSGAIEYGVQATSPLLKLPFEQLLNRSLFSNRDIERAPGELSRSGTLSALGVTKRATLDGPLGFLNILWNEKNLELFRVGDQMVKVWDTVVGDANRRGETNHDMITTSIELLLGRLYQISPEETRYWALRDWKASYGTLASLKRRAYRDGNLEAAQYYGQRMLQLELLRGSNE